MTTSTMPTDQQWALAMIAIVDSPAYQADTPSGKAARLQAGMAQWSGLLDYIGHLFADVIKLIQDLLTPGPAAQQRAVTIINALHALWRTTFLKDFPFAVASEGV